VLISKNQLKQIVYDAIPHFYSIEERESLVKNFICEILEIPVAYYLLQKEFELSEAQVINYESALENLSKGQPLQYIVGKAFFYGREFLVNSKVLIPRPETEELCQWIIEDTTLNNPSILDIGCGSGNIPITLEQEIKNSSVFAIDISTDALCVAQENSKLNNSKVQFEQMDILNWQTATKFFENKFASTDFAVYPNPSSDIIYFNSTADKAEDIKVEILDILGRVVKTEMHKSVVGKNNVGLGISNLQAGSYSLRVTFLNSNKTNSTKFVKK
jgi:SAM-dependent methyltransferase